MMKCRLCAWLCDRFCPLEASCDAIWHASDQWEQDYASDWEPDEQWDAHRDRWDEADRLIEADPAAALAIHLELVEAGSAYSMLASAWFNRTGRGTARDEAKAEEFYRRAVAAGSWKATLHYAGSLFARGAHDKWPGMLNDGIERGFIPAYFWLALYRYKLSPTRRTAREMRRLLEAAARMGHPGACLTLGRWMASGKFGLREIPRGFRKLRAVYRSLVEGKAHEVTAGADLQEPARLAAS